MVVSVSRIDTDVLLACKPYSLTGLLSYLVARFRRLGYLLDVDDRTFPSEINKWWRLPLYVQEWLIDRLMSCLAPATTVASRALAEYFGRHAVYVPNSADLGRFNRTTADSTFIRNRHGIASPVLVWPAVFFQETDRKYALEVFEILQHISPEVTLLVLGGGDYLPTIRRRAQDRNLRNIVFAGPVAYDDMPHYYASADAGFLPLRDNHYDACKGPIKLYEYMAMELPVVSTEVGEPRETVTAAGCGILLPVDDAREAAYRIARFVRRPDIRLIGASGRTYLETMQSLPLVSQSFGEVLREVHTATSRRYSTCQ